MRLRPRDLVAALVALALAIGCVGLGVWQLDRLSARRARNAAIIAARARPPIELTGRGLTADSIWNRRIHARGVYEFGQERLWRGRTRDDAPGVALLSPLRLADGSAVFVDRGWVPSPDAWHVDQQAWREPESADISGLAFPAPRGGNRGDVDPARIADSLPFPVLPFVVQQLPETSRAAGPRPWRWPAPPVDNGPHLFYAIQWFSFAVIIVVGTVFLFRDGVRKTT